MIGRVLKSGKRVRGLLYYLHGPGRSNEHVNPRIVAGWRVPAHVEPPVKPDGHRDFRRLAELLEAPLALLDGRAPERPVWHCTLSATPMTRSSAMARGPQGGRVWDGLRFDTNRA